jgi:hypothetical protein
VTIDLETRIGGVPKAFFPEIPAVSRRTAIFFRIARAA